jgi:serine/threonine protein phosphatase 1
MGNHEQMAFTMLRKLCVEITEQNFSSHLKAEDFHLLSEWFINGGQTTLEEFRRLSPEQREDLFDYFDEFLYYDEFSLNGNPFVLVHGGLEDFSPEKPLEDYPLHSLLWTRTDYTKRYYQDKYLITGHIPTSNIDPAYDGKIYTRHGHIAIDCGAGYGNPLGCIRLDDFKTFYVD